MGISSNRAFAFSILLSLLCAGCAGDSRTASIGWAGDKVRVQLDPGSSGLFGKPTLECVSCPTPIPPFPIAPDASGVVEFDFPEAKEQITTRFHLEANGIDTAFILQPPTPEEASQKYELNPQLTGRIMATVLTMVYRDTSMADAVSTLEREDEANIFGEDDLYYFVHHPLYREPLVILKTHAIRIR
jgi:hypothetical protein